MQWSIVWSVSHFIWLWVVALWERRPLCGEWGWCSVPVYARVWGPTLWKASQCQLHWQRLLPAAQWSEKLAPDQHHLTGTKHVTLQEFTLSHCWKKWKQPGRCFFPYTNLLACKQLLKIKIMYKWIKNVKLIVFIYSLFVVKPITYIG